MVEDVTLQYQHQQEQNLRKRFDRVESDLRSITLETQDEQLFLEKAASLLGEALPMDQLRIVIQSKSTHVSSQEAGW